MWDNFGQLRDIIETINFGSTLVSLKHVWDHRKLISDYWRGVPPPYGQHRSIFWLEGLKLATISLHWWEGKVPALDWKWFPPKHLFAKSQDPHSFRQYFQLNHSKFLLGWNTCLRLKLDDSNLPLLHFGCQQGRRAEPVRLALTCSRMQLREKVKISPAGEPNPALLTSTRNISSAGWFSKGQAIFLKEMQSASKLGAVAP